jgi:hypothetical protein
MRQPIRIVYHSRGALLVLRHRSSLRSKTELVLLQLCGLSSTSHCSATTVVAILSLSGDLSRVESQGTPNERGPPLSKGRNVEPIASLLPTELCESSFGPQDLPIAEERMKKTAAITVVF